MFASNREGTDPTQQYQETVFIINNSSLAAVQTSFAEQKSLEIFQLFMLLQGKYITLGQ